MPNGFTQVAISSGEVIETTFFYTADEYWIDAGDLLLSLDGEYDAVETIEVEYRTDTMYDLMVDAVHTFAVGDGQWVVHN